MASPTITATASVTPTPSQTPTPSLTPTITATPPEGQPFGDNEVGLVIMQFEYLGDNLPAELSNIEGEMVRALNRRNIAPIVVGYPIRSNQTQDNQRQQAREIAALYNATVVVWGSASVNGVDLYFEVSLAEERFAEVTFSESPVTITAGGLETFQLRLPNAQDVLYVIDFINGQLLYFEEIEKPSTAWNYDAALTFFDAAVQAIPAGSESSYQAGVLYFYRATIYYYQERYAEALTDYTRALEWSPESSIAFNNREIIYNRLGDYDQAIADFERAIALDPEDYKAFNNRGTTYTYLGQYEDALPDFDKAIELNPEFARAYTNRGVIYSNLDDYDQAIADHTRAIELSPRFTEAYANRGLAYALSGDYEAAIPDLSQAIELNPQYANGYSGRGIAYYFLGDFEAALADFQAYEALVPELPDIIQELMDDAAAALGTPPPTVELIPVTNPTYPADSMITVPGRFVYNLKSAPDLASADSVVCTANTQATVIETVQVSEVFWVKIGCDAGEGWLRETEIVP